MKFSYRKTGFVNSTDITELSNGTNRRFEVIFANPVKNGLKLISKKVTVICCDTSCVDGYEVDI